MAKQARRGQNRTSTRTGAIWEKAFLAMLALEGNVTHACDYADVARSVVYERRAADETFARRWDDAIDEAGDRLEHEAWRRAKHGTLKPVYQQGKLVGYIQEFSDSLMQMLLKGVKPDKYGDKLTIRLTPEQAALLKKLNMSASDLWEELFQEIAEEQKRDG